MNKRSKVALVAIPLLAVLSFLGLTGYKSYRHGDVEHKAQHVVDRIGKYLELDDAQLLKLNVVKEEMIAVREDSKAGRKALFDGFIEQVRSPDLDEGAMYTMVEERKVFFDQLAPRVIAPLAEFHGSLTDAQRAKLADKLGKWRDHHRHDHDD